MSRGWLTHPTGKYGRLSLRTRSIFSCASRAWTWKCSLMLALPAAVDASRTSRSHVSNGQVQRSPGPWARHEGKSYSTSLTSRYFLGRKSGYAVGLSSDGFWGPRACKLICLWSIDGSAAFSFSVGSLSTHSTSRSCSITAASIGGRLLRRPAAFLENLLPLGCKIDFLFWRVVVGWSSVSFDSRDITMSWSDSLSGLAAISSCICSSLFRFIPLFVAAFSFGTCFDSEGCGVILVNSGYNLACISANLSCSYVQFISVFRFIKSYPHREFLLEIKVHWWIEPV